MRISPELRNTYYVMRHGRSIPNEQGIIVANPSNGILPQYGLTEKGIQQAKESALRSKLGANTVIISSDFSRARQTADILRETIEADDITVDPRIRERSFGEMELEDASLYEEVWSRDKKDVEHTYRGSESLISLAERQLGLIDELEGQLANRAIVLVGHADPINVLQAMFSATSLRLHHSVFSIENAEIQSLPS